MSKHRHLYDRAWQKRRAAQLQRSPLCAWCLREGKTTAAEVADHITPHNGCPVLFAGPLQSLCARHHNSHKQQLERTGHIRGHDLSGAPIDPTHPWYRR